MWIKRKNCQEFTRWSHVGNLTYAAHHCLPSKITLNRRMKVQQVHCSRYSLMNTCSNRTPFWQQGACTKHLDNSWNGIKGDFLLAWIEIVLGCFVPTGQSPSLLTTRFWSWGQTSLVQPSPVLPSCKLTWIQCEAHIRQVFLPLVGEIGPRFTMVSLLMVKRLLHAKFVAYFFISYLDFLPWLFFHSKFFRVFIPFQSQHSRSPENKLLPD